MNHEGYFSLEIPEKILWSHQTNDITLLFQGKDYTAPATLICTLLGIAGMCHEIVLASGE